MWGAALSQCLHPGRWMGVPGAAGAKSRSAGASDHHAWCIRRAGGRNVPSPCSLPQPESEQGGTGRGQGVRAERPCQHGVGLCWEHMW